MLTVTGVGLSYGSQKLFEDVNIKFTPGNCYGVIGANGAGKSTFVKILSGEIEADRGEVSTNPGERIAVLKQDHFQYDNFPVLEAVIMGNEPLYKIMQEREEIYAKEDFSDEDGVRIGELEGTFSDLGGWEAEHQAEMILQGLGVDIEHHQSLVKEVDDRIKVKILLAQALFGEPDILLLDEPTNHLDLISISWLENFIQNLESVVIVVSHDRHFLNKVCTHIADIDFSRIKIFVGNYEFWKQSSELALKLRQKGNERVAEKRKELTAFIQRFSANASKAKQATSRSKLLEKLTLEDIQPSSRKYPFINFTPTREIGKEMVTVDGLSHTVNDKKLLDNISFHLSPGEKVAIVGPEEAAKSLLVELMAGEVTPDAGEIQWGVTVSKCLLPKDNTEFFEGVEYNLIDWIRQFSPDEKSATVMRSFLGRMLFSGDEVLKNVSVLSGGEKVRCMISRLMLGGANTLLLDGPTNHLDLESISAFNDALTKFKGSIIMVSHDHRFIQTVANRILEITPEGKLEDHYCTFDEYVEKKMALREEDQK